MPSPVAEVLAALVACFHSLGVRWYLFGAQAAIYHGVARLTADVDGRDGTARFRAEEMTLPWLHSLACRVEFERERASSEYNEI